MSPETNENQGPPISEVKSSPAAPKKKRGMKTLFLTIIMLAIVAVAGSGFYHVWNSNQAVLSNLSQQLTTGQQQISSLQNELLTLRQQLQQQQDALQHQTQLVQELRGLSQSNRDYWHVMDAQYFVKLAGDQFLLTSDVPLTIELLNQAQNEINNVTDPHVLPIKQALIQDIATLKNIPAVNLTDLFMRLITLQKQVDQMPMPVVPVLNNTLPATTANQSRLAWWQKGLLNSWESLRQIVVVRYVPKSNALPFVTPDQRPYIYQNLHAGLDAAAWAVLHRDADVYRTSLQQEMEWIKQYFDANSPLTKDVLSELTALQATPVQSAKETALVSPKAFQDYLHAEPSTSKVS